MVGESSFLLVLQTLMPDAVQNNPCIVPTSAHQGRVCHMDQSSLLVA